MTYGIDAPFCETCAHMRRDEGWRMRCHSPQIIKRSFAGTLCVFERECREGGCGESGEFFKPKGDAA